MRRMPPRDPKTGKFLSRGSRKSTGPRRAADKRPARASEASARRRSTPKRAARAAAPASRSTKGSRRSSGSRRASPQQINIGIQPVGTTAPTRAREAGRKRGKGRKRSRAREMMYEAPLATAGGLSLFIASATLGNLLADAVDRYIAGYDQNASPAPTLPAPYTVDNPIPKWNNDSAAMQPGGIRILAQVVPAALFILLGAVSKSAALKFFLYGLGGGYVVHFGTQIVTAYVIAPMVKTSTATGARMYQHEINVLNSLANPSGGILGAGGAGGAAGFARNVRVGQPPPQLPQNQPAARVPMALASVASPAPAMAATPAAAPDAAAPAAQPQTMGQPPAQGGAHTSGCGCIQCTDQSREAFRPLWNMLLERRAA